MGNPKNLNPKSFVHKKRLTNEASFFSQFFDIKIPKFSQFSFPNFFLKNWEKIHCKYWKNPLGQT
jgi:hypothetical protein